jgi:DNA repair photolyase
MKQVSNPENPWATQQVEWLGEPPEAELQVFEEEAKSVLTENDSPDIPFRYSVNPYRGCYHGCVYCYARPTHQYIDFGAGTDFERKIVAKVNTPQLLRERIKDPEWEREPIVFSGVTDCYQPLEATYELTRQSLETCLDFGNPAAIITKGALIRRDIELLSDLQQQAGVRVSVSIPFADDDTGWTMEPHATAISQRFRTVEAIADKGIPVGIGLAPVIPGLNDSDIPEILERAADCGATHAFLNLLRLPRQVKDVFFGRLEETFSDSKVDRIESNIKDLRGGELNNSEFGNRMTGQGPRWQIIEDLFETHCDRLGLNESRGAHNTLQAQGPRQKSLL